MKRRVEEARLAAIDGDSFQLIADRYRRGYRYPDYGLTLGLTKEQHRHRIDLLKKAGKIPRKRRECFQAACSDLRLERKLRSLAEQGISDEEVAGSLDYALPWVKQLLRYHDL